MYDAVRKRIPTSANGIALYSVCVCVCVRVIFDDPLYMDKMPYIWGCFPMGFRLLMMSHLYSFIVELSVFDIMLCPCAASTSYTHHLHTTCTEHIGAHIVYINNSSIWKQQPIYYKSFLNNLTFICNNIVMRYASNAKCCTICFCF